jgi:hypothetical protein
VRRNHETTFIDELPCFAGDVAGNKRRKIPFTDKANALAVTFLGGGQLSANEMQKRPKARENAPIDVHL